MDTSFAVAEHFNLNTSQVSLCPKNTKVSYLLVCFLPWSLLVLSRLALRQTVSCALVQWYQMAMECVTIPWMSTSTLPSQPSTAVRKPTLPSFPRLWRMHYWTWGLSWKTQLQPKSDPMQEPGWCLFFHWDVCVLEVNWCRSCWHSCTMCCVGAGAKAVIRVL